MKNITKIMAVLFMVLVTMSSCSKDDDPEKIETSLAEQLIGEWIMEVQVSDLEYSGDEDIEIPADADMLVVIYHFFEDGTAWKEIDVMKGEKCIFQPVSRYDFDACHYTMDANGEVIVELPESEVSDVLHFDGKTLVVDDVELQYILQRATAAQISKYAEEADALHGGSDEGGTVETGIDTSAAGDVSRADC